MPWDTSDRRQRLPPDWPAIRERALRRDKHQCRHLDEHGERCTAPATDVDHIIAGDDHSMANLQSLCLPHHKDKTNAEATTARRAKQASSRHREEPHPGLLPQRPQCHHPPPPTS